MNEELKPCPKCGGAAFGVVNSRDLVIIICDNHECDFDSGDYADYSTACEEWNKRA